MNRKYAAMDLLKKAEWFEKLALELLNGTDTQNTENVEENSVSEESLQKLNSIKIRRQKLIAALGKSGINF